MLRCIHHHAHSNLTNIANRDGLLAGSFGTCENGEKDGSEEANNRDYDEEFDKREPAQTVPRCPSFHNAWIMMRGYLRLSRHFLQGASVAGEIDALFVSERGTARENIESSEPPTLRREFVEFEWWAVQDLNR